MTYDGGHMYTVLPSTFKPRRIQPGKRTILVSLLLSFMLLMCQLFRALQLDQPPKLSNVLIVNQLTSMNEELDVPSCISTELSSEEHHHHSPDPRVCQHLPPPRGLCSLTQELFFSHKPKSCHDKPTVTFCNAEKDGEIRCKSPWQCKGLKHYIGTFVEEKGDTVWKLVLEEDIQKTVLAQVEQESFLGYVFIKCSNHSDTTDYFGQASYEEAYTDPSYDSLSQLFLYPRKLTSPTGHRVKHNGNININLVMIDSLSRTHFYRSLPKTVSFFEELYSQVPAKVLDFHYFQSIKQRTYESLQALFSGYVNVTEVPFGTYDIPRKVLPVSELFGPFKQKGYKTLWLEDMCWNWEWGLVKDLKVMNMTLPREVLWEDYKKALSAAYIDGVDITVASCEILQANGKKDPFHGLPAVCFNGKHHHEYILNYLQMYQMTALESGQSFLTYTSSSVSHDASGIRVQTIDEPLVRYLKFAAKMEKTITIVFADHGNTYGKFIQSSPEAHVETYNPALFMIVPKDVQDQLGDVQMRILQDNQRKLVSAIDIHNMLMALINEKSSASDPEFYQKYVTPKGLLSSISAFKTCAEIPLLQPSLCICRNFEVAVETTHVHKALADFGLGVLNNLILSQHRDGGGSGFGNCRPIKPIEIRKVLESRVTVDLIRYKIDVVVQGVGNAKENAKELFFLTLEVGAKSPTVRLVSFERMSLYGIYSKCQDKSVELKMCICDTSNSRGSEMNLLSSLLFGSFLPEFSFLQRGMKDSTDVQMIEFLTSPIFDITPRIGIVYPEENPCLFTVVHTYSSGFVLTAANLCLNLHKIEVFVETENLYLSGERRSSVLLRPNDVKLVMAGTIANPKIDWNWRHHIQVY